MPPPSDPSDPSVAPVARLAPSPTGLLHLGHARSFLLAWWHARSRGGRVLLRIEDLDEDRVKPGMVEAAIADLEWLGLDWDGEPVLQSRDTGAMADALERLIADGLAYPCTCSRKEIRLAQSAPHAEDGETHYPGTCRDRWASIEKAEAESGRPAGLRFRVPPGIVAGQDGFRGPCSGDPAAEVGDFLVARRDGAFAYQLAVVVDDARQGVTEVLRGDDLVGSTPRQWLLQEALGHPHPAWIHVPLVLDDSGRRLAKRHGDVTIALFRERGADPRALVAWVARSAGHSFGARASAREVLSGFDLALLPSSSVPLDAPTLAALRSTRP